MQAFLTANWRYLAMLNYVVDPRLIAPLVPVGTEIDFDNGETFLSVVGFLFLDTRILGLPIPLHRDFEEVNLRFYVRRKSAGTWRRGVVFIRELVPRRAIAVVARTFYGENYIAVPMKHEIEHLAAPASGGQLLRPSRDFVSKTNDRSSWATQPVDATVCPSGAKRVGENLKVEYSWRRGRKWESLKMTATGEAQPVPAGSHAEFITEHYWGYTALRNGCSEYQVEHPRWKIWHASEFELNADIATLYGEQFTETLSQSPRSGFIADGSPITVQKRKML
ncbi:MAG: DUF2071 domain-containing protein [Candidatus Udaeobacter sp.]